MDRNIAEDESALKELQELVEFSTSVTLINREVLLRLIMLSNSQSSNKMGL